MISVNVFGLALDSSTQVPLLILKDKQEQYVLPIWIGVMEAVAISIALNEIKMPRPMTHDLYINTICSLGLRLVRVEIVELREGTFYAELVLRRNKQYRRIDARPSDAVALALRSGGPILVREGVFEAVEQDRGHGYEIGVNEEGAQKWTDLLKGLDLDDLKYKM
jgi:hypothetical protein